MNIRNPRTCKDCTLKEEELRLIILIDRLEGVRFMKQNRARAQKSLTNVQRELNHRGV